MKFCISFAFILFIVTGVVADPWYKSPRVSKGVSYNSDLVPGTGTKFYRTELYFGRDKSDGTVVSDDDWKEFLEREVTPRFPDGFTTLDGSGQYRDKSGKIVRESSKVLVFLYAKKDQKAASSRIDEIRAAYCKTFSQESVLRLDFPAAVKVSFK